MIDSGKDLCTLNTFQIIIQLPKKRQQLQKKKIINKHIPLPWIVNLEPSMSFLGISNFSPTSLTLPFACSNYTYINKSEQAVETRAKTRNLQKTHPWHARNYFAKNSVKIGQVVSEMSCNKYTNIRLRFHLYIFK